NKAIRIQHYNAVALKSYYINTRLTRNRLGSKFRKCLYEAVEEFFGVTLDIEKSGSAGLYHYNGDKLKAMFIELDVNNIEIRIPKDVQLVVEVGATQVHEIEKFAKTQSELD
ncbi:hypothetical protein CWB99_24095, partial [Pseudoalteromonas rubra]